MSEDQQMKRFPESYHHFNMEPEDSFDYLFKIVLIGDMGVGKTCIVQR
ncbi:unnamed protein product [Enterobius vermicularis]|uniref:Ras family protein n=1 Tax=Enterobius vermicularis TaxID=51028 RepID=A0A0N4UTR4_ENTVE|nr:unnamed protein product [Enterobius vermicularis]